MSSEIKSNVISEVTSGSGVSIDGLKVKDSALVTDTNKYAYLKSGELNSKGFLNNNFFGFCYVSSAVQSISTGTWTEVTGTWAKQSNYGGSTGQDDSDLFGKFAGGRWTPTKAGYYCFSYALRIGGMDSNEVFYANFRKNGTEAIGYTTGAVNNWSTTSDLDFRVNGTGVMGLDTDDYVSLWCFHNEGGSQNVGGDNFTYVSGFYLGTSDL